MDKLFVSYSRSDGDFALRLASDLRAQGVDLWIDQLDIDTGARWDHAVEEALRSCDGMVMVLSPASVESPNVLDEVSYALDEGKALFPVMHEPCDLPYRLRRVQYTDLSDDYDAGLARLVEDIRERAEAKDTGQAVPPRRRTVRRARVGSRLGLALGVTGIAIVAAAGFAWYAQAQRGPAENPPIVEGIKLPAWVITDSAFPDKNAARRRLVELSHAGFTNTGFFHIPAFEYLSGADLYQVYIGPFRDKQRALRAICNYERKSGRSDVYGVRLSTLPGREEFRCPR